MFQVQETYLKTLLALWFSERLQPFHTVNIKKYKIIHLNSILYAMCSEAAVFKIHLSLLEAFSLHYEAKHIGVFFLPSVLVQYLCLTTEAGSKTPCVACAVIY